MRDTPMPPDEDHDAHFGITPQRRAAAIRAAAAEVLVRVQEWRDSPHWRDDDTNRDRYRRTADAVATLDRVPDPSTPEALSALVEAIRPILHVWRPGRPGAEQAIHSAVQRLQRVSA
ncbi:hypothetical protein ACQEVC_11670 [Plantactinospora sp. CA-294935]|uniref:hypothetical protein n=1 Tax=Plantactinospora sp. CA-294935 TaxID=3240012 RepID=UPI003D8AD266